MPFHESVSARFCGQIAAGTICAEIAYPLSWKEKE